MISVIRVAVKKAIEDHRLTFKVELYIFGKEYYAQYFCKGQVLWKR